MHGISGLDLRTSPKCGFWSACLSPREPSEEFHSSSSRFYTTHWSLVLTAQDKSSPASAEAMELLCRTYWYPLYAYVRRQGHTSHDAQDLTQEFFSRLLEKGYLHAALRKRDASAPSCSSRSSGFSPMSGTEHARSNGAAGAPMSRWMPQRPRAAIRRSPRTR